MANIDSLDIRNLAMLAAGKQGDDLVKLKEAYDAGACLVVTKSITQYERKQNTQLDFVKVENGYINNVGLANIGAEKFAEKIKNPGFPIIVSLAGSTALQITKMINIFDRVNIVGYEINLSCPNAPGYDVGDSPDLAYKIIKEAKNSTDKIVFAKVAHHMRKTSLMAEKAGADAVTAINTVPALNINMKGGLSGRVIQPIALRAVHEFSKILKIPIIGCGGISNWKDCVKFHAVGAYAVQIGSAAMVDPSVFGKINRHQV